MPKGKIAPVIIDNVPQLLDGRDEPYVFKKSNFKLYHKTEQEPFFDTSERLIVHGNLKRVMPHSGEVAITFDKGQLVVIKPEDLSDGPKQIDSPFHDVVGFMRTSIHTFESPSKHMMEKRRQEQKLTNEDEIHFNVCNTSDPLKVGVRLGIAYQITDPEKAIKVFAASVDRGRKEEFVTHTEENIRKHIEEVAIADIAKVIQRHTSQEFLSANTTVPGKKSGSFNDSNDQERERKTPSATLSTASSVSSRTSTMSISSVVPSSVAPSFPSAPEARTYHDEVVEQLAADLEKYGITLIRFSVETQKILEKDIVHEMGKQAIENAKIAASVANADAKVVAARRAAEQDAQVSAIKLKQANANLLASAQAKLEAAELDAKAIAIAAQAKSEADKMQGEVLKQHPELVQLQVSQNLAQAFSTAHVTVTSTDMFAMLGGTGTGLFSTPQRLQLINGNERITKEVASTEVKSSASAGPSRQ